MLCAVPDRLSTELPANTHVTIHMPIILLFLRLMFPELLNGAPAPAAVRPDVGWLDTAKAQITARVEAAKQAERVRLCWETGFSCDETGQILPAPTWDYSKGPPPIGGSMEIHVKPYKLSYEGRIVEPGDADYAEVVEVFDAVHERGDER